MHRKHTVLRFRAAVQLNSISVTTPTPPHTPTLVLDQVVAQLEIDNRPFPRRPHGRTDVPSV